MKTKISKLALLLSSTALLTACNNKHVQEQLANYEVTDVQLCLDWKGPNMGTKGQVNIQYVASGDRTYRTEMDLVSNGRKCETFKIKLPNSKSYRVVNELYCVAGAELTELAKVPDYTGVENPPTLVSYADGKKYTCLSYSSNGVFAWLPEILNADYRAELRATLTPQNLREASFNLATIQYMESGSLKQLRGTAQISKSRVEGKTLFTVITFEPGKTGSSDITMWLEDFVDYLEGGSKNDPGTIYSDSRGNDTGRELINKDSFSPGETSQRKASKATQA